MGGKRFAEAQERKKKEDGPVEGGEYYEAGKGNNTQTMERIRRISKT